ncbi:unnamed protein product [Dicrocoelium dendriticum]|nr:unnamed protein product [Dicrocoelium dendriticum]
MGGRLGGGRDCEGGGVCWDTAGAGGGQSGWVSPGDTAAEGPAQNGRIRTGGGSKETRPPIHGSAGDPGGGWRYRRRDIEGGGAPPPGRGAGRISGVPHARICLESDLTGGNCCNT